MGNTERKKNDYKYKIRKILERQMEKTNIMSLSFFSIFSVPFLPFQTQNLDMSGSKSGTVKSIFHYY